MLSGVGIKHISSNLLDPRTCWCHPHCRYIMTLPNPSYCHVIPHITGLGECYHKATMEMKSLWLTNTCGTFQPQKSRPGLLFPNGYNSFQQWWVFGHKFTLNTDHKPLQSLFSENKPIPAMASGRIQRWALTLASYEYTIKFKKGPSNANADALSRLPVPTPDVDVPVPAELVLLLDHIATGPLTAAQIKNLTQRDKVLPRVYAYVLRGWPASVDASFNPYSSCRHELSVCNGCVLVSLFLRLVGNVSWRSYMTLIKECHVWRREHEW